MNFENFGRRSGDEGIRDVERAFNADLYNEPAQEAYFAELNRRGVINEEKGRTTQEQLYAALCARSTPEAATTRMNQILERFQMRGAVVPVESLPQAGGEIQAPENRWVAWRRVFREQTEAESKRSGNKEKVEIPGRIEKIFRVNVLSVSTAKLLDDVRYRSNVDPRIRTEAAAIEAVQGADTFQGWQEVSMSRFDRSVTTDEVKAWLDENELCTSMRLMLTIDSQLPEEQDLPWMGALDDAWISRGFVPVLSATSGARNLGLDHHDEGRWFSSYRFPAARKKN